MAKIVPLFSSSKGNSYYICGNNEGILVDAGRSCKQLENALIANEIDIRTIKGIFITHEHIDHCQALKVLAKRYDLPVFGTCGTLEALLKSEKVDTSTKLVVVENEISLGDMSIKRVDTSHDCSESCGFLINTADKRKCCVVTDTGYLTSDAQAALCSCNLAVIESNHDIDMLKNGPYPYVLKQRVMSSTGHLSNIDCAHILPSMIENGVTRILLAHLSQENNTVDKAVKTSCSYLEQLKIRRDVDFTLDVAPVETNGKSIVF